MTIFLALHYKYFTCFKMRPPLPRKWMTAYYWSLLCCGVTIHWPTDLSVPVNCWWFYATQRTILCFEVHGTHEYNTVVCFGSLSVHLTDPNLNISARTTQRTPLICCSVSDRCPVTSYFAVVAWQRVNMPQYFTCRPRISRCMISREKYVSSKSCRGEWNIFYFRYYFFFCPKASV
jgi:hypothetical protein